MEITPRLHHSCGGNFYFQPIKTLSSRHGSANLGAGGSWWDKGMTIVQFDRGSLMLPPKAVVDFLLKLDQADDCATERRESERRTAVMEVAVVPVDFELRQCGESFLAISKDLSSTGMAIIHTRAIHSGSVVVEILNRDESTLQLLAYVVRCDAVHRFYEIGLRFVTRLAKS